MKLGVWNIARFAAGLAPRCEQPAPRPPSPLGLWRGKQVYPPWRAGRRTKLL